MNIYVGNLSLETSEDELRKEFIIFGEVLSVTIMNDRYIGSGQPRGYGYVEMASKSEGATAIANLEGKILRDKVINVVEALPLSDKHGTLIPHVKYNNRSNKSRVRKYQMIWATWPML
jgi:cold-inducible RNA-binding protein